LASSEMFDASMVAAMLARSAAQASRGAHPSGTVPG
jgi:hypothetical protein